MLNAIRRFFTKPSAHVLAQQSLDEHMRSLLSAQQELDAARNTVQYHRDCISRLQRFLVDAPETTQ